MPKGTEVQVGFFCPQSKHIYRDNGALSHSVLAVLTAYFHTLFAGFVFNLSKIFSDCCLVARGALIVAGGVWFRCESCRMFLDVSRARRTVRLYSDRVEMEQRGRGAITIGIIIIKETPKAHLAMR